jgi:hypothetical protein
MTQPDGICRACFWTWSARRPRPPAVYCWHSSTVARLTEAGDWLVESVKGREALERLRQEGVR